MYSESASKGLLGDHTMVIDAEGVSEKSAVGESKIAWSGIERIEDDGNSIYFYIGPVQAYVIPKRAFPTREDEEAFLLGHQERIGGEPRYELDMSRSTTR